MKGYRFGRKLQLPSTIAVKHQVLMLMLRDEIGAVASGAVFQPKQSPALEGLKRLRRSRSAPAFIG
ncbi:MAG TPA: hypothetical protein VFB16_11795 [Bauldia sp.]|nr:hypothetical protein [Bauldia sp.]